MLSGWRSKALWVAALLPLLAANVLPTQIRTLVCRFTGAIMQLETCCPSELDEKTPPAAQLLGESCCVTQTMDLPRLLSEQPSEGLSALQAPPLAPAQPCAPLVSPAGWTASIPSRPPPHGPPILLVKRSFLI